MATRASCIEQRLGTFLQLTKSELQCLAELQASPVKVGRGQELVYEGQAGHKAYILQSGWACSFKLLRDGGRQIIGFPIPGDCIGLRSVLLRTSDHSFSVITDAVVSTVETPRMLRLLSEFPRLAAAVLWAASRDEAMIVEHLVSIGRRSAIERTAHFFLELGERLRLVGLATDREFHCPLNQYLLADALGLTPIHVNRVLRELREKRLFTLRNRTATIRAPAELAKLAGFVGQRPAVRQD